MSFTTSIPTISKAENSTVADTAVINITSNQDYLYTASDFKITSATEDTTNRYIGGDLPVEISEVTFTDNSNGSVDATITFSGFPMDGDKDLRVPIESKLSAASYVRKNYACITARYTTSSDHTVTVTDRAATVSASTSGTLTLQQIHKTVYHAKYTEQVGMQTLDNLLALITFEADSGKYYSTVPTPEVAARDYTSFYNIEPIKSLTDYDDNKNIKKIIYAIRYTVPDEDVLQDEYTSSSATCALSHFINFNYEIATTETAEAVVKINKLLVKTNNISSCGEGRLISIFGNSGAGGKLHMYDKDGKYYDSETGAFTLEPKPISFSFTDTIKRHGFDLLAGRSFNSDNHYCIHIEPNDGTTLDSSIPTVSNQTKIYQYKRVKITSSVATSSYGSDLTLPSDLYVYGNSGYSPYLKNRGTLTFVVVPDAEKTIKINKQPTWSDVTAGTVERFGVNDVDPGERGDVRFNQIFASLSGKNLIVQTDVIVEDFGYTDYNMQINLDNFITVS
tara:strand:+ start:864 stop:2384 length:1521 start_codon:yes stop_codon:yes gene_type:complete